MLPIASYLLKLHRSVLSASLPHLLPESSITCDLCLPCGSCSWFTWRLHSVLRARPSAAARRPRNLVCRSELRSTLLHLAATRLQTVWPDSQKSIIHQVPKPDVRHRPGSRSNGSIYSWCVWAALAASCCRRSHACLGSKRPVSSHRAFGRALLACIRAPVLIDGGAPRRRACIDEPRQCLRVSMHCFASFSYTHERRVFSTSKLASSQNVVSRALVVPRCEDIVDL